MTLPSTFRVEGPLELPNAEAATTLGCCTKLFQTSADWERGGVSNDPMGSHDDDNK